MQATERRTRRAHGSWRPSRLGGFASAITLLPALVFLGTAATGTESPSTTPRPPQAPLFQSHDVLELTLKADLNVVTRDVSEDREEHDATLSYTDENGELIKFPAQLNEQVGDNLFRFGSTNFISLIEGGEIRVLETIGKWGYTYRPATAASGYTDGKMSENEG